MMDLREEYKALVEKIKSSATRADGKSYRYQDIADRLQYDRTHLSKLLSEKGEITEKHIRTLKNEFAKELQGGGLVEEPEEKYQHLPGYVRHLEERLEKQEELLHAVLSSLETVRKNQQVIAAMDEAANDALLSELAERRKLKPETFLRSVRNKAFSKLRLFHSKGIEIEVST